VIQPVLRDEALLADIAASESDGMTLWWLGQSGFLVRWDGAFLLLDPYLSDSLTSKYAATAKPHERMTERVIDPSRLDMVDVVTSSHGHTDHLDADTLRPLLSASPGAQLVAPHAILDLAAERSGLSPDAIVLADDGRTVEAGGFSITGVAAAHERVERDDYGHSLYVGYLVRRNGRSLFHAGDTVLHDGLEAALRGSQPDVALLPINGSDPARGVAGNLDGVEAAHLAHDIGARLVVPCHFEMFAFNTASPAVFQAEADRLDQPYRVLRAGERLRLPTPEAPT
jgi:L-ascorbate metabolism protein UlaG (beta-lactamase superfamily)